MSNVKYYKVCKGLEISVVRNRFSKNEIGFHDTDGYIGKIVLDRRGI